jgi:hypothetical protein
MANSDSIRSPHPAGRSKAVVSPDSPAFYCSVFVLILGNAGINQEEVPDGL